jgi:hypothetical protein
MEVSMDSRKFVLKQTMWIAIGEVICVAAMIGVFALLGQLNMEVLWGSLVGLVLSVLDFFFMALFAQMAADKAQEQDVKTGKKLIQLSMLARLGIIALVMSAFAISGICHVLAMVLPLAFSRPILMIVEFFRKGGGDKK